LAKAEGVILPCIFLQVNRINLLRLYSIALRLLKSNLLVHDLLQGMVIGMEKGFLMLISPHDLGNILWSWSLVGIVDALRHFHLVVLDGHVASGDRLIADLCLQRRRSLQLWRLRLCKTLVSLTLKATHVLSLQFIDSVSDLQLSCSLSQH